MAVTINRGATEYVGDPVTFTRGSASDIVSVASLHTQDPTLRPLVAQFVHAATLVSSQSHPLWAGTVEVVTRIGPRAGAVSLAPGDWQRWVLVSTADEDIIESTGTVTIL